MRAGAQCFRAFSGYATLPGPPHGHQPGSSLNTASPNPCILGSFARASSTSSLSFGGQGVGLSKSHLIDKLRCGWKGLVRNNKRLLAPFTFITHFTYQIPKVWGALYQEWEEERIFITNQCHRCCACSTEVRFKVSLSSPTWFFFKMAWIA